MLLATILSQDIRDFVVVAVTLIICAFPLLPIESFVPLGSTRLAGLRARRQGHGRPRPAGTPSSVCHRPPTVNVTPTELREHMKAAQATGRPLRCYSGWEELVPGYPCLTLLVVTPVGCGRVFVQAARPTYEPLRAH